MDRELTHSTAPTPCPLERGQEAPLRVNPEHAPALRPENVEGLTLVGHIEELRRRIIISVAAVGAVTVFAFPFSPGILSALKSPASGVIEKLIFFDPAEAFLIHIKISFFTGLVISMPVLLYQSWAFISPAAGYKVKRQGLLFLFCSVGAFASGAAFGFFILLPAALKFLLGFAGPALEPLISASSYVSFVIGLTLGPGLVFEMPVLSYLLSRMGVIDYRFLRRAWKYAVVVIFIVAAVVTPTPDAFNMTILALPMLALYEVSIWVAKLTGIKR